MRRPPKEAQTNRLTLGRMNCLSNSSRYVHYARSSPICILLRQLVAPSLLACDFAELCAEIRRVEEAGGKVLHLDIMDGHFVPNLSFGLPVVEAIRRSTNLPLDVHLMIAEPARFLRRFREAGADLMTIHIEAVSDPSAAAARDSRFGGGRGNLAQSAHPPRCDLRLPRSVRPRVGDERDARLRRPDVRAGGVGKAPPLAGACRARMCCCRSTAA